MKRFILVGDGYFARRVAEAVTADPQTRLVAIFTDTGRENTVSAFSEANDVLLHNGPELLQGEVALPVADWLLNVNSTVILPERVLAEFPDRALNLHNGPLPEYAGRHVHQWGIRNGETTFASTIHLMEPGVDTGAIVASRQYPIYDGDTGLSLFRRSFDVGVGLMMVVLEQILADKALAPRPQDLARRRLYRHADALDGRIDWRLTTREIVDFVRASNYRPLRSPTYTAYLEPEVGGRIELFRVEAAGDAHGPPGTVGDLFSEAPLVSCGDGAVRLVDGRCEGRRLTAEDWNDYLRAIPGGRLSGHASASPSRAAALSRP